MNTSKFLSCSLAFALTLGASYALANDQSSNQQPGTTESSQTTMQDSQATQGKMSKADVLSQIHTTNQNEISMAKMALDKAQDPQVKKFARRMIKDHTQADKKVMKLAKKENVQVQKMPLTAEEQGMVDQLEATTSTEFDKAYMEANRKGHDKAISMLENAQNQVSDPQVKQLITKLLPKIEHHDQLAKKIKPAQESATS